MTEHVHRAVVVARIDVLLFAKVVVVRPVVEVATSPVAAVVTEAAKQHVRGHAAVLVIVG